MVLLIQPTMLWVYNSYLLQRALQLTTRERENTLLQLQPINWARANPNIRCTHRDKINQVRIHLKHKILKQKENKYRMLCPLDGIY